MSGFEYPFDTEDIMKYVDAVAPGNPVVKTSIDIAIHDFVGKLLGKPVHSVLGLSYKNHDTSMTIGIDTNQGWKDDTLNPKIK